MKKQINLCKYKTVIKINGKDIGFRPKVIGLDSESVDNTRKGDPTFEINNEFKKEIGNDSRCDYLHIQIIIKGLMLVVIEKTSEIIVEAGVQKKVETAKRLSKRIKSKMLRTSAEDFFKKIQGTLKLIKLLTKNGDIKKTKKTINKFIVVIEGDDIDSMEFDMMQFNLEDLIKKNSLPVLCGCYQAPKFIKHHKGILTTLQLDFID